MTINLGMKVKDELTGYTGVVVARSEWLWGCVTIGVLCGERKDNVPIQEQWFDEGRLVEIEGHWFASHPDMEPTWRAGDNPAEKITGGPARHVPSR